jgi:hypothetical protein
MGNDLRAWIAEYRSMTRGEWINWIATMAILVTCFTVVLVVGHAK